MDQLNLIQTRLENELREMNAIIHRSLNTSNELMNQVVTNYLTVKGKQIRPIMVILSAGLFGNVNEHVLHAGAALEMLHNASLIHDDVVDETTLRRGRATVNSIWGNHIAVLVGDYFVSNALAAGIQTNNIEIISALSDLGKELSIG
ncbi:MAG: polyprenyl synthetase family protein, partial [Muribaculaceae bacterium]|nr:polyprenyl synthetase family protein [Muribaculaceae bacterium]